MGWLTALTAFLWLLAVTGVSVFYGGFVVFILPGINEVLTKPEGGEQAAQRWRNVFDILIKVGHPIVVVTLCALVLAAMSTVALIYVSRRATMRQMTAGLADISAQIRQLQAGRGQ